MSTARKRGLGRGLSALISKPVPVAQPTKSREESIDQQDATPPASDSGNGSGDAPKAKKAEHFSVHSSADSHPSSEDTIDSSPSISFMSIAELTNDPLQPRQHFDAEEISSLASSIQELGVLQPILVRERKEGSSPRFEIIAGERRWRAAKEAKLTQVPVIIRDIDDQEALEIAIVENVQRANLSPLEEATAYKRLADEFALTQKEIAARTSKDRTSISNSMRLLSLPDSVKTMLEEGAISVGHAKAILTVKEPAAQFGLAKKVKKEGLSVRALEDIVSRVVTLEPEKAERRKQRKAARSLYPEIEQKLQECLGSKVKVRSKNKGKGSIQIEFYSEDELSRLVEIIDAV